MENYINKEVSMTEKIVGQIRTGMKPTDLMIGDWVLHFNKPCKVLGIKDIHKGHDAILLFGQNGFRRTGVEPIPLTVEILEKNGWKKGWINGGWCYNHELKFLLSPNKDSLYLSITNHGVYIHHVHELQHALRLCGLEELADNLQI